MSRTVRNQTPAQRRQHRRLTGKQIPSWFDETLTAFFEQRRGQANQRVPCLVCEHQLVRRVREHRKEDFYAGVR